MVLVGEVGVAAGVDQHVLGLRDEGRLGQQPTTLHGVVRKKVADLSRQVWIGDVVDPQSSVEPSEISDLVVVEEVLVLRVGVVLVVRAEAPATLVEVGIRSGLVRNGDWQQ
jgi:hypothetical protein